MFVLVSNKLLVNADHITCISRDDERPKAVRISYTNTTYTLIGLESEEMAENLIAAIYNKLNEKVNGE